MRQHSVFNLVFYTSIMPLVDRFVDSLCELSVKGKGNKLSRVAIRQCDGRESNSRFLDHESDALTTTPLSHPPSTVLKVTSFSQRAHSLKMNVHNR